MNKKPQSRWLILWTIWLVTILVTFFVFEIPAIVDKSEGDTLSEIVRFWATSNTAAVVIFILIVIGIPLWFAWHILIQKPKEQDTGWRAD